MDTNTAIFFFQMTVSAASLGGETCIPVNGAPERCGVMLQTARVSDMDTCKRAMEKEHRFWYNTINRDPEMKATGAVVWVKCSVRESVLNYNGYEMDEVKKPVPFRSVRTVEMK